MEEVLLEQQRQEKDRKMSRMSELQEENQMIKQNENNTVPNKQNRNQLVERIVVVPLTSNICELSSSYSSSSTSHTSCSVSSTLSNCCCCCHHHTTKTSQSRQSRQNADYFEDNTTLYDTSQSSLNTSNISCTSTHNQFENLYFTRIPAPSSTISSTHTDQKQLNCIKQRILNEELEEQMDGVQAPSELSDIQDEEEENDNQTSQDEYQSNEDLEESSSYLQQYSEILQQNAHQAKLIATGSSCQIYSLDINQGQDSQQIGNIVLKTSHHYPNSRDDCNSECHKLGKEFFVLKKFSGHPNIIQAYLLENDLTLPLQYNVKRQNQYLSNDSSSNCSLVMEQATCDLITYFSEKVYEDSHHYQYLQNKLQLPQICRSTHFDQQNLNFYSHPLSNYQDSFYNCFPGIFYDILTGLEEVHTSHQLAHNDIKPENMLFFENSQSAKICDFEHCGQRFDLKRTDYTYQSPEIVEIYKEYRDSNIINDSLFQLDLLKNDVFSFGVTLFSTMFGFYPFCDEFQKNAKDELYSLLISADVDSFWQERGISSICQKIEENTSSTYLYNFQKFIEETLEDNPSNRIDTSSLMNHDFFEEERHFRFEKDWSVQNQILGYPQSNSQQSNDTNNFGINENIKQTDFSTSKLTQNEKENNQNKNLTEFQSPLNNFDSNVFRNRQISIENDLNMVRQQSFELKFDPKKSPVQSSTSFTLSPSNRNNQYFLQDPSYNNYVSLLSKNKPNDFNQINQNKDEEDEKLTETSDIDCNSSKEMDAQKCEKRIKDDFFLEDVISETDEDEGYEFYEENQE